MGGRSARTKGASAERELCKIISTATGLDIRRTPNSGGLYLRNRGDLPLLAGDLTGLTGYHIEAKRQETIKIAAWTAQAEADCPEGSVPVLAYRRSREPWRVVLPLDHFLKLIQPEIDRSNNES